MHIGERIKAIRGEKGIKQSDMANQLGITGMHVYKLEVGKAVPSTSLVRLISLVYGVREEWLLDGIEPMHVDEVRHESRQLLDEATNEKQEIDKQSAQILDEFAIAMDGMRCTEDGNIGYSVKTESEKEFLRILNGLVGRVIDDNTRNELFESACSMAGEDQTIFYRYGVSDTIRFIFEAANYGEKDRNRLSLIDNLAMSLIQGSRSPMINATKGGK